MSLSYRELVDVVNSAFDERIDEFIDIYIERNDKSQNVLKDIVTDEMSKHISRTNKHFNDDTIQDLLGYLHTKVTTKASVDKTLEQFSGTCPLAPLYMLQDFEYHSVVGKEIIQTTCRKNIAFIINEGNPFYMLNQGNDVWTRVEMKTFEESLSSISILTYCGIGSDRRASHVIKACMIMKAHMTCYARSGEFCDDVPPGYFNESDPNTSKPLPGLLKF